MFVVLGACGVICGKKQDVKGRVEPEKEVYKETQKEVIIPRFHEESIKGKRYKRKPDITLLIFTLLFPATDLQNKHMYAGHSFPV